MRVPILFALPFVIQATCASVAAESVYTREDQNGGCSDVVSDEYGMGGTWSCPGYRGITIHYAESDLRQSIFYGHLGPWHTETAAESFGGFNHAGPTVEWRVANGRAFATIRRWFVAVGYDDRGNPLPEAQILVIARIGQPEDGEACVVGYVEATANAEANAIARRVADDEAAGFACRYAEPMWYGARRHRDIEPVRWFGETPEIE